MDNGSNYGVADGATNDSLLSGLFPELNNLASETGLADLGNSVESVLTLPSDGGAKHVDLSNAGVAAGPSNSMNNNSLFTAIAGDATQLGLGFIAADAAKTAVKKNPNSVTTIVLVAGGVAALFIIVILAKKK